MEIYGVWMNRPLHNDEIERMMNTVSEERRAKVQKFVHPEDGHRGLVGELLVRAVIRGKFHVSDNQITFAVGRYGKPYAQAIPSFHYNVSHSGRWIVCAVDSEPIGIDIEEIKPVSLDIAKQFFSAEEYRFLMNKAETDRISCFYELWTLKESFIKRAGNGLSIPLNAFSIRMEGDRTASTKGAFSLSPCFFKLFDADPGYKLAVCTAAGIFPERIRLKTIEELW